MNQNTSWHELQEYALRKYYPALFLDRVFQRKLLFTIELTFRVLLILFFIAALVFKVIPLNVPRFVPHVIDGLLWIVLAFWLAAFAIRSFYYSYYFADLPDGKNFVVPTVGFELGRVLYQSALEDPLKTFLEKHDGRHIMLRAGISQPEVKEFLHNRKVILHADALDFKVDNFLSFSDYVLALFDADAGFSAFLFSHGIQKKDLEAITDWIIEKEIAAKKKRRWWSRERLGRVPGIGKNWSYGQTYNLNEYSRELPKVADEEYEVHSVYGTDELKELEAVLIRSRGANALIVSDDRSGALEIVARLSAMIEAGTILPELEHKKLVLFDADILISKTKIKGAFESELLKIMNEASYAGNIILVLEDLPAFITSAQTIGSDIISFLDPYFTSDAVQIIGLSGTDKFHSDLEPNAVLMQRFERILVKEVDAENTVRVLENEIILLEKKLGVTFTYPALTAIAESAERYFPSGIMPDKAVDLLLELAPKIAHQGKKIISKEDVLALVQTKTGIPVGEVGAQEKDVLLNLEKILHQRIIGQDEAITAISNAARRARSGINSPNRPMGSFLFLGPTGVGKTETTKALADVFFGGQGIIERLDMSEYSGADAVEKLIGSSSAGTMGTLTTMLREHPYGVLLLDEFEKTTSEVMNLFLQILDEGMFSDMTGKKVNAKNLLIIATSNAGSDLIWDAVKKGDDLNHAKDLIIESIIHARIFKPELLNRFDGVVIFHPLTPADLTKIARLQLEGLKKRLAVKGINLAITDELVQYVAAAGTDPKFGARPMNRAIQDKVEQVIAEKMIRGGLKAGAEVSLTAADFK